MTYKLWWTVGYVCTTDKEFKAAKHRLIPAVYEVLDDALRRANQVSRAGGVAWLLHAIFPFAFQKGGSRRIKLLHERMVTNRHRTPTPQGFVGYAEGI